MGVVHLGVDPHGRAVAIKVLRAHVAYDPDARARLNREVATLSRVRHRQVAEVLDADVDGDQPYVVTRYVPGPTLEAEVRERGPMPAGHLVQLGRGLSSALEAIHAAGVVHRDLKPANVLLLDGDPVVIDFGIAHVADDVRLTMTGLVMGTPGYLAPELIEGSTVTLATDWWGWAATLAFAASGHPPFGRGPSNAVIDRVRHGRPDLSGIDERLRPLLQAALSPQPSTRPGAAEVLAALERFALGGAATVAVPGVPPTRPFAPPTASVMTPPTKPAPVVPPQLAPVVTPPAAPVARVDDPLAIFGPAPVAPEPAVAAPPKPRRTATLLAYLVALVGIGSAWPTRTALVAAALVLLARTADRAASAAARRREERGARGSDPLVAAVSAPWHVARGGRQHPGSRPARRHRPERRHLCGRGQRHDGILRWPERGQCDPDRGGGGAAGRRIGGVVGSRRRIGTPRSAQPDPGHGPGDGGDNGRGDPVPRAGLAAAVLAYTRGHPDFGPLHQLPLGINLP